MVTKERYDINTVVQACPSYMHTTICFVILLELRRERAVVVRVRNTC